MWNQVHAYFTYCLHFTQLTLQALTFCHHNTDNDTPLIQNHVLLLLKLHIFIGRKYGFLSFNNFLNEIDKTKNLERGVAVNTRNKRERFRTKSNRIENEVPKDQLFKKRYWDKKFGWCCWGFLFLVYSFCFIKYVCAYLCMEWIHVGLIFLCIYSSIVFKNDHIKINLNS